MSDLDLTPVSRCEEGFDGSDVRFNARASHRVQQEFVALCIARAALEDAGYYATQHAVVRLARAIMLPRSQLLRDMAAGMSLAQLRAKHVHATTAMIGARLADLYAGHRALSA